MFSLPSSLICRLVITRCEPSYCKRFLTFLSIREASDSIFRENWWEDFIKSWRTGEEIRCSFLWGPLNRNLIQHMVFRHVRNFNLTINCFPILISQVTQICLLPHGIYPSNFWLKVKKQISGEYNSFKLVLFLWRISSGFCATVCSELANDWPLGFSPTANALDQIDVLRPIETGQIFKFAFLKSLFSKASQ